MGGYFYTTKEGDMWDYIAWIVYQDELKVQALMQAPENYGILEYYIFPAGVKVWCPAIEEDEDEEEEPSWRDDDDDSEEEPDLDDEDSEEE